MRSRRLRLFLVLALGLACLFGCSRESSIRENVNLRNNHSVVFAFNKPFENAEAFADSIINLSNPDSVLVYDTLTITVNDTVYLMGFLRYNSDKVYRYIWHFEEPYSKDNKDTLQKDCEFYSHGVTDKGCNYVTESSANAMPHFRVYPDTGIYSPLFIAIDGNNARDTAGIGQYVRVINTPPYVSVPKDTLWTRAKGEITFTIVALDSFGTIESLKIDLDASGKGKPEKWKFKELGGDTLSLTIKYDSSKVDSIGNQKIYVIAIDDDGNETKDSVNLHFNQKPKLKPISPEDNSTQNERERLILHYEAIDADNPAALRYFVRAANPIQSDTSIEEFVPNFTNRYLVAEDLKEPYFVAVDANGNNKLKLTGRIYWDVWVTDGYDTVYADKIKEKDGTKRPRTFLLVDLKNPYGVFMGYAQYQGRSNHAGILVELKDSVNSYLAVTNDKGYFSVNVPSGSYRMIARDTAGYGYKPDTLPYRHIEVGQTINLGKHVIKDPIEPNIILDNPIDTIFGRTYEFSGKAEDYGSQVKNVEAWLDGEPQEITFFGGYNKFTNKWTWRAQLDDLTDGKHTFEVLANDSAGLKSPKLTNEFFVMASSIRLLVNGKAAAMEKNTETLKFTVKIVDAHPMPDSLFFVTNMDKMSVIAVKVKADSTAEVSLKQQDFPAEMKAATFYTMTAQTDRKGSSSSNTVRFGFLSDKPAAFFLEPGADTTISMNDVIHVNLEVIPNNDDPSNDKYTLSWNCGGAVSCITANTTSGDLSWKTKGTHLVIVDITNDDGKKSSDTITVNVVSDPPKISALTDSKPRQKIKASVEVNISASDKLGTVNKISWGCSAQKNGLDKAVADNKITIDPPTKSYATTATLTLPGEETSYYCVFEATDDDEETARDTLTFEVVADKPFVHLNIKQQTLTINDETDFLFMAGDSLGQVVKYEKTCSKNIESLNEDWLTFGRSTTVTMPNSPGNFYCAIRVTDDDGNTATDTATYNVLRASPTVTVMGATTVTIKDNVNLDADARDSTQYNSIFLQGHITKYEWGCGANGSAIAFTSTSTTTPEYTATMPNTPDNNYLCIVQVTDDDGNTARDTAHINVLLDPPTVSVKRESITVRQGFNILLDATASDGYGSIVKNEWSCGTPSTVEGNWKTVDDLNTTWEAPAATLNYMCIVQVTDDDGNTARDTTQILYSTGTPVITVKDELIYVMPGQEFELSATKNDDVWPNNNVSWYKWQCYYKSDNKSVKDEPLYSFNDNIRYDDNNNPILFYAYKDSSYTGKGKDIYCVVSAEEISTGAVFSDTTQIKIIVNPPQGVITAADTVFLWSGDSSVSNEGFYFYTPEWGGMNSTMGPIGDINNRKFNWQFSNVGEGYYEGNKDGTLDTSKLQFNEAFKRSMYETSRQICLDFRDSNTTLVTEAFYLRHRAEEVCRTIYFRKAWRNLSGTDTVVEKSTFTVPPVLTTVGTNPLIAYMKGATVIGSKYHNGTEWVNIDASNISITSGDTITKIAIANNGTDAYLAVLTKSGKLNAYKSASGTSTWSIVGNQVTDAKFADIAVSSSNPVLLYIKADNKPQIATLNGNSWSSSKISDQGAREIKGAFTSGGALVVAYIGNTSNYQGYFATYDGSPLARKTADKTIVANMSGVDVAIDGSDIYIAFSSRETELYGPIVKKGSLTNDKKNINFDGASQYTRPFTEGKLIHGVSIAAREGNLFAIIDDNSRVTLSQSHAYRLDGSSWKVYGENELPYFKVTFYNSHHYYLRGYAPDISVASDGKVFISMLAWENAGGRGENFGPLVMKYVADTWTVH